MESSIKVLQSLLQKIQSPLQQIRNRAITTLYTKVSAKIINQVDLTKSKQLPGVLFHWINESTPVNKDCLYKVLSILHRYTLTDQGIRLLFEYEALQFLQQFRKFLMSNQTNVDEQCDIIKKIIKLLLPLQNNRIDKKNTKQNQEQSDEDGQQKVSNVNSKLNQQQVQDSQNQDNDKVTKAKTNIKNKAKQSKRQRNIMTFVCLSDDLPKQIDQQLYALVIQLKHGKKQTVLQTLVKIQQIASFWGNRYFKYKQQLVKQLVTVIQGKVYSQIACRIISLLLKQLLQMQQDIGIDEDINSTNFYRNYLKTTKISSKGIKTLFQKIDIELKFQIFQDNPFTYHIFQTLITKNKSNKLSSSVIQYLLIAVQKFQFSAAFLPNLLSKITHNNKWLSQKLSNKFYQEQLMRMINHCCHVQSNIYSDIIPYLDKLFPQKSFEQIAKKIPNLSAQLQQQQIQHSFNVLVKYSNNLNREGFDFNLELHQLQFHIKNLQKGMTGLPKKPQIISLYIDCLLMLAVSVAKQDALMSFYPKIKALIQSISQHQYLICRVTLFDRILLAFNSSEKINYLAQSYLKSQVIRLVFTDAQFYSTLLIKSLNQQQTIGIFLQITKILQATTKQDNRKYLNKYSPIFYILSYHISQQKSTLNSSISINSAAKIICSRFPKKYQAINVLMSLFSKSKQQRMKTYVSILGLSQSDDLMRLCLEYKNLPQKKVLKYSLSTIKNYMNIIMNHKLQNQIKSSAIDEMIECSQRIDLNILQKNEQFLQQILSILSSVQDYIKSYIQKGDKQQQIQYFNKLVRIYSILYKRLRLQTNYLNQSIKCMAPQVYLNILINICGGINEQGINSQKYRYVISQFMTLIYYHCFTSLSSNLLLVKQKDNQFKKNIIKVHWITEIFPHQILIKSQVQQINFIPKRIQLLSQQNKLYNSKQKQKLIDSFLKSYKLNIKSQKQLIQLYIQKCNDINLPNQQIIKSRRIILCPILQKQLSSTIHNITSCQGQLQFLNFILDSFAFQSTQNNINFFQPLPQIIPPNIMNQLLKPNVPQYLKILLINICNTIGWKRTKTFDGLLQQINPNQLYYLKLVNKLPKLGSQQLGKIIKTTLTNVQNPNYLTSICLLWKILLKTSNLKTLILSSSQYTQLLVLNTLIKCIQHEISDQRLINFSIILLHQISNYIYFQIRKLSPNALLNCGEFDQDKQSKKIVNLTKLILSLSIGSNIMSFINQQFQKSGPYDNNKLTLQNICFLLESLKTVLNLTNFATQNQLYADLNLTHDNKLLKLFIITFSEYIRSNPQIMSFPTMQIFFSSILNFINSLTKTECFYKSANQVDFLDLSLTLFHQKTRLIMKNQPSQKINKNISETLLLFSSILEYCFMKIQSQASQSSHYLLSSTNFLESSINLLLFIKNKQSTFETDSRIKIYVKELLQKFGKVVHIISLHQEDYLIFKLNQLYQQLPNFNLLQTFGKLVILADENFIICFMRLILIWQGHTQENNSNRSSKKAQFQTLNPLEIFQEEQEDDSSLQERQLFQNKNSKNNQSNLWIHNIIDIAVQKNQVRHCKSLLALSLPAKMLLIQKPAFYNYLKKMGSLIDSKIMYESTANKKKPVKKTVIGNNSSVLLSNSRKTVISQNQSYLFAEDQIKNSTQEQKLLEIQEFIKILVSLFAVNEGLSASQKMDVYVNSFTTHLLKYRDVLRKVFSIVDNLYNLSELLASSLNQNKQFINEFMKLINALSQSIIFSQSLSNHLTQFASPMLETSITTILKGIQLPLYQQDSQKLKQALQLLTALSNHQSVRSYIYKRKLIEQLNLRIIKYEQKKTDKNDFINLNSLYDIVGFYLNLSHFKDSHNKILNDKKVLQVLINQVYMQKSDHLSQKILQLLSNLSAYKLNKAVFMQNRQIHKTLLGQLQSEQIEYKSHLLTLLYNLVYRHAPGVKIYKHKDVIATLENIKWQKYQNWQKVKHIFSAVLQVLKNEFEIPDKI